MSKDEEQVREACDRSSWGVTRADSVGCTHERIVSEQDIYGASRYVASITLSKLAELFSSARNIMDWLATCASLVAKQGQPMTWVRAPHSNS